MLPSTSSPSCCFPFVFSHPSPSGSHQPRDIKSLSPPLCPGVRAGGFDSKARYPQGGDPEQRGNTLHLIWR
ncbi:hypothetical protein NQZ68_004487 [Dissostichus eleginoides]|nr:hypothetical protein NQZ68_004487 [Dissostichus eleginoides]